MGRSRSCSNSELRCITRCYCAVYCYAERSERGGTMKQHLRSFLMLSIAAVCIAAIALLHRRVLELKGGIAERNAYVENLPAKQQRTLQLQEQLTAANASLKQLSGTLVSRDDLSGVITNISLAAVLSSVAVQIPEVESETE